MHEIARLEADGDGPGRLGQDGTFVADEILAKHDENYMPPEVARAIKEKHGGVMPVNPDHKGVPRT